MVIYSGFCSHCQFCCELQIACMQSLPQDVILAIVLADLPVDLERRHDIEVVEGNGASWWYLTCECDDYYVNVVEECVSLCTFAQIQAICSVKSSSGDLMLQRCSPFCKGVLEASLRFAGRFEFDKNKPVFTDEGRGLKVYEGLDFGTEEESYPEGRNILLKCYVKQEFFDAEVNRTDRCSSFCRFSVVVL